MTVCLWKLRRNPRMKHPASINTVSCSSCCPLTLVNHDSRSIVVVEALNADRCPSECPQCGEHVQANHGGSGAVCKNPLRLKSTSWMSRPFLPNRIWIRATGTPGTDSISSYLFTPTKSLPRDGKITTISYRIMTISATTFELYFVLISTSHRHNHSILIVAWRPSKSRSCRKTLKTAIPMSDRIATVAFATPAEAIHTPGTHLDHQKGTIRMPNLLVNEPNSLPYVSSAEESIVSSNALRRRRQTANRLLRRNSTKDWFEETTTPLFASPSMQVDEGNAIDITTHLLALWRIRSRCLRSQMFLIIPCTHLIPWPDYITPLPLIDSLFIASISFDISGIPPPPKIFFDDLTPPSPESVADSITAKVNTPYNAAAFFAYLHLSGLSQRYPLPFKLTFGFPIGRIPPLTESYCPPNLPSASPFSSNIRESIESDLALGRLSGPFTREQLESKIGFFRSSPIQVSSKDDGPGTPVKHRVCRNLSYRGQLDSDCIDAASFPTRWDTAILCASIVSVVHLV